MNNILYESEIFNKEMKGTFPFKIKVLETITDITHKVEVIREEFEKNGEDYVVSNQSILNCTIWKE